MNRIESMNNEKRTIMILRIKITTTPTRLIFGVFFFIHVRRIVIFVCKIEFKAKSQELLAKNNSFNIFT